MERTDMEKKTLNLLVISLSVISIVLIIIFGGLSLWTDSYLSQNYYTQYQKYDSIKTDMTKEQVQSIMKTTPVKVPIDNYTFFKDFDEVLVYVIPLPPGETVDDIVVFCMEGKVVGKKAYTQNITILSAEEFNNMKKSSVNDVVRILLMMTAGIIGATVWLIIFPKYDIIQKSSNKKFWIDVLLGFCFVTTIAVIIWLGLLGSSNIANILDLTMEKSLIS
jgi:hypothetical protein